MQKDRQDLLFGIFRAPYGLHASVIAKIDGHCVRGLTLAMYCDLRVAADMSMFGVPVTDIGQISTGSASFQATQLGRRGQGE